MGWGSCIGTSSPDAQVQAEQSNLAHMKRARDWHQAQPTGVPASALLLFQRGTCAAEAASYSRVRIKSLYLFGTSRSRHAEPLIWAPEQQCPIPTPPSLSSSLAPGADTILQSFAACISLLLLSLPPSSTCALNPPALSSVHSFFAPPRIRGSRWRNCPPQAHWRKVLHSSACDRICSQDTEYAETACGPRARYASCDCESDFTVQQLQVLPRMGHI